MELGHLKRHDTGECRLAERRGAFQRQELVFVFVFVFFITVIPSRWPACLINGCLMKEKQ